jgi:hypothetical protein
VHGQNSFDYAVIRVVPSVEREEFLNAGVIVFCLQKKVLDARVRFDEERFLALWPELDVERVKLQLRAICEVCAGKESAEYGDPGFGGAYGAVGRAGGCGGQAGGATGVEESIAGRIALRGTIDTMPITNYSVLAGVPVSGKVVKGSTTHYQITVKAKGGSYVVALNIESAPGSEVLYVVKEGFVPPDEAGLLALPMGMTAVQSVEGGLRWTLCGGRWTGSRW